MPLITTLANASARGYGQFSTAGAVPAVDNGAMFPLGMVQVGSGGASTIDFTSIPSTYKHLQIRLIAQKLTSSTNGLMRFNGDTTGTNYYFHGIEADGSTAAAYATNDFPRAVANVPTTANIFAVSIVDILDYANTSKYKTVRTLNGFEANNPGILTYGSGLWKNTNAITSLTIYPTSGNFAQFSSFALYGIKGA